MGEVAVCGEPNIEEQLERMVILLVKEERIRVSASLLTKESPVFARMIEGNWKESNDGVIKIDDYTPTQVKTLVECLQHSQMQTFAYMDYLILTGLVMRSVLPLVQYYEVESLKKKIFNVPLKLIAGEEALDKPLVDKMVIRTVMAIEANYNSHPHELPDWPKEILELVFRDVMKQDLSLGNGEVNFSELSDKTLRAGFILAKRTRGLIMRF